MPKIFSDRAWEEYESWLIDKKTLKRINLILQSIERNGVNCIGQPHALTGNLSGWWSVKINEKDRIVFRISGGIVEIAQCKGHYDDK